MARAAEVLGDRWTLLILREAFYGVQRYDDMREDLGAPRSMLTDRLGKMVETGLMTRKPYQEPGARIRYAYSLTQRGRDVALTMMALTQWGEKHILGAPAPVDIIDTTTGRPVQVALVDDKGDRADLKDAAIIKRKE
ncbi:Uncharacterized HTH-type transcriptional regulator Rv3095 [Durusdinium trenchii]|uniref:Uncharacterized HTH-type transcriptional regulator Rv3095 n=1 Tax=Durusdinium trenchii TaxID=1381693 RepID=A0ABP0LV22_9DINO